MNERKYFFVRTGSNTPEGPLTLAELANMKATGELTDDTPAAANGAANWSKLGELLNENAGKAQQPAPTAARKATHLQATPQRQTYAHPALHLHPMAYRGSIPPTAGPCPSCSHEIPLNDQPILPERCPHCGFIMRPENPGSIWQNAVVALKKTFVWRGRATRMEYWSYYLFNIIVILLLSLVLPVFTVLILDSTSPREIESTLITVSIINAIIYLGLAIPGISVAVRRLHDTGRSGFWLLAAPLLMGLIFLSVLGFDKGLYSFRVHELFSFACLALLFILSIVLFIFSLLDSQPRRNKYGASPKYPYL